MSSALSFARLNTIRNHLLGSASSRTSSFLRPAASVCPLRSFSASASSSPSSSSSSSSFSDNDILILSAARTPIGAFQGTLSSLSAVELGVCAVKGALERSGINVSHVNDVILGNVVSANLGQSPATQVSILSGIPSSTPVTTINKVCSSGLKSVMFGAQTIKDGSNQVVVAGGFESMSNIPYYVPSARAGAGMGHQQLVDGILRDGLWDPIDNHHMGNCAEICAKEYGYTRAQSDEYALKSYHRALKAQKEGRFKDEIVPVTVKNKKGEVTVVEKDEEPSRLNENKIPLLKSSFIKDGTVTAANASKINDGAAAFVLCSGKYAREKGLKPVARVLGYADAQKRPVEFPTAPAIAIPKALSYSKLNMNQIDYWEINEAFSAVAMANMQLLSLSHDRVNVNGGAVALGHPIGSSGGRILVTLINVLKQYNGKIGCAAICNGGGGASAVIIERL